MREVIAPHRYAMTDRSYRLTVQAAAHLRVKVCKHGECTLARVPSGLFKLQCASRKFAFVRNPFEQVVMPMNGRTRHGLDAGVC
jgi:hypothetical protein